MAARRSQAVAPFQRNRARRCGGAEHQDLEQLYRELDRLKQHYIARWNDRAAVFARLMELMEKP